MYMNMYVHTLGVHHLIMYHGILTTSFILHPIKRCKLYSNYFQFLTFLCACLNGQEQYTYILSHPLIHTYVVHGIHMHTHSSIAVQRHWALLSHPTFLSFNLTNHWCVPRVTEVAPLPLLSDLPHPSLSPHSTSLPLPPFIPEMCTLHTHTNAVADYSTHLIPHRDGWCQPLPQSTS